MKLKVTIEVDASSTIVDSIKRGSFRVDKDGSGHKLLVGSDVVVPSRKCVVSYADNEGNKSNESTEILDTCGIG